MFLNISKKSCTELVLALVGALSKTEELEEMTELGHLDRPGGHLCFYCHL